MKINKLMTVHQLIDINTGIIYLKERIAREGRDVGGGGKTLITDSGLDSEKIMSIR